MELSEAMKSRRSVRVYDPQKSITKEEVEELIEAALLAPSWKNSETARYYVALTPETKKAVVECMPDFNKSRCQDASAIIVTGFVKSRSGFNREKEAENELGEGWGCYDLGLANQNLLLKATQMGYATLIMGLRDSEKLAKVFDVPEDIQIVSVISVGIAMEKPDMPKRRKIEDVTVFM